MRLLDRMHRAIRVRQYSLMTEKAYLEWAKRFILFHGKRHPAEMGKLEVETFLTHLAPEAGCDCSCAAFERMQQMGR